MKRPEYAEKSQFQVIVNYKKRYGIWPLGQTLPAGWRLEGTTGTKHECLRYLLELWKIPASKSFQHLIVEQHS